MYEKRVNWLQQLYPDYNKIDISNVVLSDLIPWHTKSKSDIKNYILQPNIIKLIIKKVISPLAEISSSIQGKLQNKVIVRSSMFLEICNSSRDLQEKITENEEFVVFNTSGMYPRFNSFLSRIKINGAEFLVFSGGANMLLPTNPNYTVTSIGPRDKEAKSLTEFLFGKY